MVQCWYLGGGQCVDDAPVGLGEGHVVVHKAGPLPQRRAEVVGQHPHRAGPLRAWQRHEAHQNGDQTAAYPRLCV